MNHYPDGHNVGLGCIDRPSFEEQRIEQLEKQLAEARKIIIQKEESISLLRETIAVLEKAIGA